MTAPDRDDYYLALAFTVATRSPCGRQRGGAVLVTDDRVIATGHTGVPDELVTDGQPCAGCRRPEDVSEAGPEDLTVRPGEVSLCVQADLAALMSAARHGASTAGAVLYATDQPDFASSKALVQAGVAKVVFARTWNPDDRVVDEHRRLQQRLDAAHVPTEYEIQVLE